MSAEARDKESTPWFTGWRKGLVWLIGAAVLAIVGYRGALGGNATSLAVASPPASAENRAAPTAMSADRAPGATESRTATAAPSLPVRMGVTVPVEAAAVAAMAAAPPPDQGAVAAAIATPPPADPQAAAAAPSPAIMPDGRIILNLADETDLRKLPGIGAARARAIVAQRERAGRFRRLEDLLRVKGIGRKRLALLRPKVVLDAP